MDTLLTQVLAVHGGLAHWSERSRISTVATIGGPFWEYKGQGDLLGSEVVELDTQREIISLTNPDKDGRIIEFHNGRSWVGIRDRHGTLLSERLQPRASFDGYTSESKWDATQAAYFISYALWHYLTEPFLFTYPRVTTREIEPWEEGGQVWRRLVVSYPTSLAVHSATETYYFDGDFHQRRMDYEPEINGGAQIAHYTSGEQVHDGVLFPIERRVYPRLPDGTANTTVARITIDLSDIKLR